MPSVRKPSIETHSHRLVVAGGGTGGHLFPGIALAQAFMARRLGNQVLFINAGRYLDVTVLQQSAWPYATIPIEGIKGRGMFNQLKTVGMIPRSIWRAASILKSFSPHVVLGVGGYSAGPVVVAAWCMGIPTVLHEQNRLPGMTNRLLHRIVKRIYLTFADDARRFDTSKTLVAGNPVRDEFLILGDQHLVRDDPNRFNLLILGGSQGARAINQAVMDAIPRLAQLTGLKVVHQTGAQDEAAVAQAYKAGGITATAQRFFKNIATHYQQADLIIARAGATTVAEITVVGRAAIFVPYPHAADDHQTSNAQALVAAGAAEMIIQSELNGPLLGATIAHHMRHRE
ncbi:MAG: undecaprenyldiphospho-muramoylpentapeptide beta-N-acetylglucosaminyltransferase, partial [Desulfatitalea sp.]|nr:undecaprenyldiphospho-muramoylpentapeptide beta-N-acetylglucosaminyltransferase [Desulfatitalea sp.]NNK01096.1 undecaprenyldiphospho-muramoylpentapeptide beta-N-acetylglucosaminyltransferase [Desulfatitalea sp.]